MDKESKDLLHTIASGLRKARAAAAKTECAAYDGLAAAEIEGREMSVEQGYHDYAQGKFAGLSAAVDIVDEVMGRTTYRA